MDIWDIVTFSSDNEEASHFGEKENILSGNLYDIETVAIISASQNSKNPTVHTSMVDSHLCIAINSTVLTFVVSYQHLQGITKFDAVLDCISLSHDCNFLITGSRDGTISLTYLPLNNCFLTKTLVKTVDEDIGTVFRNITFLPQITSGGSCEVISITESNCIFQFSNIHLSKLQSAFESGDNEVLQKIVAEISNCEFSSACKDFCVLTNFSSNHLLVLNSDVSLFSLAEFKLKNALSNDACFGYEVVKARATSDGRYALILDSSKKLNILNLKTFIIVERWSNLSVVDFTLIETIENSNFTCLDVKVLILTCSVVGKWFLQIVKFPCNEEIYSVEVSPFTYLIDMPPNQDCILFLEAFKSDSGDLVTNIKIRKIAEASQEARLSRLLNKCQFDEALVFAQTFSLNVETVYLAKVKYLLEQLLPWKTSSHFSDKRSKLKTELFECLDKISDINHVVMCCVNSSMPCLMDTREMLLYAKSKLNVGKNVDNELVAQVFKTLNKLEIFSHVYGEFEFSSRWDNFIEADLWEELLYNLSQKRLDIVSLLWEHNIENFLQNISPEKVIYLLRTVPEALISVPFRCWLKHSFLPVILSYAPNALETVGTWIIQSASTMELSDKSDWPSNAILFIQMFIDVCQELSSQVTLSGINFDVELALLIGKRESVFGNIRQLLDYLHDLRELHHTYKCKISLADYTQEDKETVVFELLDWVNASEEIPAFVTDFLKPFTKRHSLNIHKVLYNYIQDVLGSTDFDWWYWEEPPWEKQILALIDCLNEEEFKLQAICHTLKAAPVPWSSAIHRIVKQSLMSRHPLTKSINVEIKRVDQKIVYMKYGFQKYSIFKKEVAKTVTNYILQQDVPSSVADALVVINAFNLNVIDSYVFRMKHLIVSNKLLDLIDFLENMPPAIAISCCKRIVLFTADVNNSDEYNQGFLFNKFMFTQAAIYALGYLKRHMNSFEFEEYDQFLKIFNHLQQCQIHFNVHLRMEYFNSVNECHGIFEKNVESFLTDERFAFKTEHQVSCLVENERKKSTRKPVFLQLFYLAEMLGLKKQEAWNILAKKAFEFDKFDLVVTACKELCSPYLVAEATAILIDLFFYFVDVWVNKKSSSFNGAILNVLANIVASVAVTCDDSFLEWCASLSHWVHVLKNIRYKGSFTNVDSLHTFVISEVDPYNDWSFTPIYKETALQVEFGKVLWHIKACVEFCSTVGPLSVLTENSSVTLKSFSTSITELIKIFGSKGQLLLAQHILISSIVVFMSVIDNEKEHPLVVNANSSQSVKLTRSILINVFGQRHLDYLFTVGLLLNLPKNIAVHALESMEQRSGFDYRKLQNIAVVGIEYTQKISSLQLTARYRSLLIEAEWGRKLSKFHINFKDVFCKEQHEKMALIIKLANHGQIGVPFISQFCTAFKLDLEQALLSILDLLLNYVNIKNSSVKQNTLAQNRSQTEIFQICSSVINKLDNKTQVLDKLNRIYSKVDPYNYEILEFILDNTYKLACSDNLVIVEKAKKAINVLNFLKTYKRIGEPSEYECDLLFEEYNEKSSHDSRIKDRLPYHPLLLPTSAVKILASELTTDTIDIWLPMAPVLQVCKDVMIMMTVENLVCHFFPKSGTSLTLQQAWTAKTPDGYFLNMVSKLVSRIDDLEKAVICSTSVVKRLPPSSCKVLAIKEAICLSRNWLEATEGSKKAECVLRGLQRLFSTLACVQILYEHGLEDPQYLSFIEQPQELICELLDHPSIEQRYWVDSKRLPDVYGACEKIADETKCEWEGIRYSLLAKWLLPNEYSPGVLDETVTEDLNLPHMNLDHGWNESYSLDEQNLKRAIYVLQRGSYSDDGAYLLNVIFSSSSAVTYRHKFRALKCLLHVTDIETIESLVHRKVPDICNSAEQLYCGSQLELLNICCELPSISDPSVSQDLALQLLQSYSKSPTALHLAAELCLHSKLHTPQIWNSILKCMVETKLYNSLKKVLESLTTHCLVFHTRECLNAWTAVLKDDTADKNEDVRGLHKLILLHRCPVLMDLDLVSLAEYFNHLSLPILAIDCLVHLPDHAERMQRIRNFVTATNLRCIMQHLKELCQIVFNLYHLDEVAKVIFVTLASKGFILNSQYSSDLKWFENYMMNKAEIDSLLKYAAQNKMWNECCIIIQLYCKSYPDSDTAQEARMQDVKGIALLEIYAKINKLEELTNLLNDS